MKATDQRLNLGNLPENVLRKIYEQFSFSEVLVFRLLSKKCKFALEYDAEYWKRKISSSFVYSRHVPKGLVKCTSKVCRDSKHNYTSAFRLHLLSGEEYNFFTYVELVNRSSSTLLCLRLEEEESLKRRLKELEDSAKELSRTLNLARKKRPLPNSNFHQNLKLMKK